MAGDVNDRAIQLAILRRRGRGDGRLTRRMVAPQPDWLESRLRHYFRGDRLFSGWFLKCFPFHL